MTMKMTMKDDKARYFPECIENMLQGKRCLTKDEIEVLERECECTCEENWNRFYVSGEVEWNKTWCFRNHFSGTILLDYSKGMCVQFNEYLSNVVLKGGNTKIQHNKCEISNTYMDNAIVCHNAHSITTASGKWNFNSMVISVGAESAGGRPIRVTPESTMIEVCKQLTTATTTPAVASTTHCGWNVIRAGGRIERNAGCVVNVYVEKGASIVNCNHVENAVLLEGASVTNNCKCINVYLQWKVEVRDGSVLEEVLIMEATHVGPSSVIMESIVGPDGAYSCGEIHASLLGPFVVSHHQSLLIGVLWPAGRGNVGYGANVGSNHTGRLANQEAYAEEGTFWGLSCVIIFPVSLTKSYYSLVSAGTKLSSCQIDTRPFSLITSSSQIIPGWVYWYSPYTLVRNQSKYQQRSRATHHSSTYQAYKDLFFHRYTIIHSVYQAHQQLLTIGKSTRETKLGISAYRHFLQRFCLSTWFYQLQQNNNNEWKKPSSTLLDKIKRQPENTNVAQWNTLPWEEDTNNDLLLALAFVIFQEFHFDTKSPQSLCQIILDTEKIFVDRVILSYRRDEVRGIKIIPNYASSHVPTEKDSTIQQVQSNYEKLQQQIQSYLSPTKSRL